LVALRKGIPVHKYEGPELDIREGRILILKAISEMETLGIDVEFHYNVLADLDAMLATA
jgi:hypothetical protein